MTDGTLGYHQTLVREQNPLKPGETRCDSCKEKGYLYCHWAVLRDGTSAIPELHLGNVRFTTQRKILTVRGDSE